MNFRKLKSSSSNRVGAHFKLKYKDMLTLKTFLFNVKANFRCKNPFYFNNHCIYFSYLYKEFQKYYLQDIVALSLEISFNFVILSFEPFVENL